MGNFVNAQTVNLLVQVDKLKSDEGTVHVTLKDSARKIVSEKALKISDKTAEVVFENLKPAKYAVRVYHDENSNGKLDRALLGIRKESWGVSNDSSQSFGPARFRKMLFDVKADKTIVISVRN